MARSVSAVSLRESVTVREFCTMKTVRQKNGQRRRRFSARDHLFVQNQIERRAHTIWMERGCPDGDALTDWVRAEHEVIANFCEECAFEVPIRAGSVECKNPMKETN